MGEREAAANGQAGTNITDTLDSIVHLDGVRILVGEWIPFGANLIANLNDKLGSVEKVKHGLFTSLVDEMPDTTRFAQPPSTSGSKVMVLEYHSCTFVNFTADVRFEEDAKVVQIEEFGVSVWKDGTVMYGMQVDSVMDNLYANLSLDHISRLLIDIHQDSSQIAENLISAYQRNLIFTLYNGHPETRPKFNILIAERISPHHLDTTNAKGASAFYLNSDDRENELKQVLGDTRTAFDVGDGSVIIFGRDGILLTNTIDGKGDLSRHEALLVMYLSLMSKDMVVKQFFTRIFHSSHILNQIRHLIREHNKYGPGVMLQIKQDQATVAHNLNYLEEILGYMLQALEPEPERSSEWSNVVQGGHTFTKLPKRPLDDGSDKIALKLYDLLHLEMQQTALRARVTDMQKNLNGCMKELAGLKDQTDYLVENSKSGVMDSIDTNTKNLEEAQKNSSRANSSLEIMQVILAGSLAFDVVDRLCLFYMSIDHTDSYFWKLVDTPFVWFFCNMVVWALGGYFLITYMRRQVAHATGILSFKITLNKSIDMTAFNQWLSTKEVSMQDVLKRDPSSSQRKVCWTETDPARWMNRPVPALEIVYDPVNGFLCQIIVQVERDNKLVQQWTENELQEVLEQEMSAAGVLGSFDNSQDALYQRNVHNPWKLTKAGIAHIKAAAAVDANDSNAPLSPTYKAASKNQIHPTLTNKHLNRHDSIS